MTDLDSTTTDKPTSDSAHPPLDPMLRVNAILDAIGQETKISPDATIRLRDLITKAVDERVAEMDDIRVGRVLGSALATL